MKIIIRRPRRPILAPPRRPSRPRASPVASRASRARDDARARARDAHLFVRASLFRVSDSTTLEPRRSVRARVASRVASFTTRSAVDRSKSRASSIVVDARATTCARASGGAAAVDALAKPSFTRLRIIRSIRRCSEESRSRAIDRTRFSRDRWSVDRDRRAIDGASIDPRRRRRATNARRRSRRSAFTPRASIARHGGRKEQAHVQGQEGREEESVRARRDRERPRGDARGDGKRIDRRDGRKRDAGRRRRRATPGGVTDAREARGRARRRETVDQNRDRRWGARRARERAGGGRGGGGRRRDRCAFRACGMTMGRRLTPSVRSSRSVDPFTKKDWYDIKAPSMFSVRNIGKTLVSRTQGTKVGRARDEG